MCAFAMKFPVVASCMCISCCLFLRLEFIVSDPDFHINKEQQRSATRSMADGDDFNRSEVNISSNQSKAKEFYVLHPNGVICHTVNPDGTREFCVNFLFLDRSR
jgi:hypothetical protein